MLPDIRPSEHNWSTSATAGNNIVITGSHFSLHIFGEVTNLD